MPPTTVGPALLVEPPLALMPFTVWNSFDVSYSQITLPSFVEIACRRPSHVDEKRTPGMTVTAAAWDGRHCFLFSQVGGGTDHIVLPVLMSNADIPPLALGSFASKLWFAAKTASPFTAAPHMTPPLRFLPIW